MLHRARWAQCNANSLGPTQDIPGLPFKSTDWGAKSRNLLKGNDLNAEYSKVMRDKEDFAAVEKAVRRLTILAFVLGVLHVLGQLFLAQR